MPFGNPLSVFSPRAPVSGLAGRERLHRSVSGSWRRESLLRILALLHHNTHDVSTFAPLIPSTHQTRLDPHGIEPAHPTAQAAGTRPRGAAREPNVAASRAPQPLGAAPLCHLISKLREIQFLSGCVKTFSSLAEEHPYQIFVRPGVFLSCPVQPFGQQLGWKNSVSWDGSDHKCTELSFKTVINKSE